MGYFDFLIEQGREPSDDKYIYNFDMIWKSTEMEHIKIQKGALVENVIKQENGSYLFNVVGSSEIYTCNYPWAFVRNTEDNHKKLEELQVKLTEQELLEKDIRNLRDSIETLKLNS